MEEVRKAKGFTVARWSFSTQLVDGSPPRSQCSHSHFNIETNILYSRKSKVVLHGTKPWPMIHSPLAVNLCALLSGIQSGGRHLALCRADVKAVRAEGVVPHVEHVFPAAHHPVLHWVRHFQHGATLAGLITHHQVLQRKPTGERRSDLRTYQLINDAVQSMQVQQPMRSAGAEGLTSVLTLISKLPILAVERMIGRPTSAGKMCSGKLDPAKPHLTN